MRKPVRSALTALIAVPLVLLLVVPAAQAEDASDETRPAAPSLVERLAEAVASGAATPAAVAEALSLPAEGGGSLRFDDAGRVGATITFASSASATDRARVAAVAEVTRELPLFRAVSVWVDPGALPELVESPGVRDIALDLRPFTEGGTVDPSFAGPVSGPLPQIPGGEPPCNPLSPIEAAGPLRSALAQETYDIDGSGVMIGILSDSYDTDENAVTSAAEDVAAGALPGEANPCGFTSDVQVLDDTMPASDEGRAMAQLVHGVAPGAQLAFATAGTSEVQMATNIIALADAGADIIVDDITFPTETYFQRGLVSAAITLVREQYDVAYFTSAGNSNGAVEVSGTLTPVASWQTTAYRSTECPSWLVQGSEDSLAERVAAEDDLDCLDFDPGPAKVPYDTIMTKPGDSAWAMQAIGAVGEPFGGVTTGYEVRFYVADDPSEPELLAAIPAFGASMPGYSGQISAPANAKLRVVMVRTEFDPSAPMPPVMHGFIRGSDAIAGRAFLGNGTTDRVGPMVYGHNGDGAGIGVASTDWEDPSFLRPYSSLGPATLWFEDVTFPADAPKPALPEPITIDSPQLASVDGTATTFFGGEDGGVYRFFGTSAAAPNAAAVAALALSAQPNLEGGTLVQRLLATTREAADGGPANPYPGFTDANVFGAGLVDAMGLMGQATVVPPTQLRLAGDPGETELSIRWDQPGPEPQTYCLEVVTGTFAGGGDPTCTGAVPLGAPASGGTAAVVTPLATLVDALAPLRGVSHSALQSMGGALPTSPVPGYPRLLAGSSTGITATGLPAGTEISVRLTALGANGEVTASRLLTAQTASPAPGPGPGPAPSPTPGGDTGQASHVASLPATGGADTLPRIVGGAGALILLAAALVAVGVARSRRQR